MSRQDVPHGSTTYGSFYEMIDGEPYRPMVPLGISEPLTPRQRKELRKVLGDQVDQTKIYIADGCAVIRVRQR